MSIFKTDNLKFKKRKTDSRAHIPATTAHCWLSGHTVILCTQPDPQASVLPTGDATVLEAGPSQQGRPRVAEVKPARQRQCHHPPSPGPPPPPGDGRPLLEAVWDSGWQHCQHQRRLVNG